MWTALSYVFYAVANVATGGVMVYLFKYVIGRMDLSRSPASSLLRAV